MKTTITALGVLLLIGAGCHHNQQTATTTQTNTTAATTTSTASTPPASVTPEQLGALGAEIKRHPNDARKLIMEHGMTEQSFAAAVRKVSENPADAKRYAAAYKQAS